MSFILSELQLIFRRSLANWRLLSTIMVGVLATIALISNIPFYSNVVNDYGLRLALRNQKIEVLDQHVFSQYDTANYENYSNTGSFINQQVSRYIGSVIRQEETWIKSQTYYVGVVGKPLPPRPFRPTGHFHIFSNLEKHITVIEGEYSKSPPDELSKELLEDPAFAIEGMIGSETADIFGVGVGDRLIFLTDDGVEQKQITVKLTAIIDPVDPGEEYWFLMTDVFTVPPPPDAEVPPPPVAPIFIPEKTLFNVVTRLIPATQASYNWFYYVDIDRISPRNVETITDGITSIENQLAANLPQTSLITVFKEVVNRYQEKLMFTQIPLFLILSQIVAIILYYLVMVGDMIIERQARDIVLLRSRGASIGQIIRIYFIEGLFINIIGVAVGPFLGALIFSLLGKTSSFSLLTGGNLLPVRFSGMVFLLAIVAAILCLLALMIPAIRAAYHGVAYHRQQVARPYRKPFIQRYYLDLVMLVLGGVLYWELRQRGSLLNEDIFGGLDTDPLLLVTPILMLVAVAIVVLRLFPIAMRLVAGLGRNIRNTPIVLGLLYIARNPGHYSRLILLLIMASSVAIFAATLIGTLELSYSERAMYSAGSDVRIEALDNIYTKKDALEQKYSNLSGVEELSLAYRINGTAITTFSQPSFTLLAVDPVNTNKVAWYRDDFASRPLQELMNLLAEDKPNKQGLDLPDGTEAVGVWVYPTQGSITTSVFVRIENGLGHYIDYELGSTNGEGWQYLETKLTRFGSNIPPPSPLSLTSLYIRENLKYQNFSGGVYLDDLQIRGSFSSEPAVIEDFEGIGEWTVLLDEPSKSSAQESARTNKLVISSELVYNGAHAAKFTYTRPKGPVIKGISPNMDSRPLAVVASRSFMNKARISTGDLIQLRLPRQFITASVVDVVDYFPTLDPAQGGFLIANIDRLSSISHILEGISINPNEVWLTVTDDTQQRAETVDILGSGQYQGHYFYDKDAIILSLKTDPLAGAGWSGMLMIAFLSIILISSLGFVVYNYLSAQGRQFDFAILRALGFSLRQIIGLVCFEQLFVIISGVGIGTLIGERLNYIMLPFLQLTETGDRVLPPFILTTNWGTLGIAYIIIAVAFIITSSLVILFFSRMSVCRTLRILETEY